MTRTVRLRHVAEVNPPTPEFDRLGPTDPVTFLPLEAIWPGESLDTSRLRPKEEVVTGYTRFRSGDILVPKITPTFQANRSVIVTGLHDGVGSGTTELHVIRPGPSVDGRYLHYTVSSRPFLMGGEGSMIGVAGQKRVPDEYVRDFPVLLPDTAVQRAIANYLDAETARIDLTVSARRRQLALIRERADAAIAAMLRSLGAPSVPLRRIVDLVAGFSYRSEDFRTDGGGVRLLRGTNLDVGRIRWDECVWVDEAIARGTSRFALANGDVVIGMDRPVISTGVRVAQLSAEDVPSMVVQRVARLRARADVSQDYLYLASQAPGLAAHFEPMFTGVSVPHVSPEQILSYEVPLPSRVQQEQVVRRAQRIIGQAREYEAAAQPQVNLLLERRQALITSAVTGRLEIPGVAA